jgi:hypothetical protein
VAVNKELGKKTRKAIQRGVVVFIEVVGLQPCAINNMFLSRRVVASNNDPNDPMIPLNIEIRMILMIPLNNEIHIG